MQWYCLHLNITSHYVTSHSLPDGDVFIVVAVAVGGGDFLRACSNERERDSDVMRTVLMAHFLCLFGFHFLFFLLLHRFFLRAWDNNNFNNNNNKNSCIQSLLLNIITFFLRFSSSSLSYVNFNYHLFLICLSLTFSSLIFCSSNCLSSSLCLSSSSICLRISSSLLFLSSSLLRSSSFLLFSSSSLFFLSLSSVLVSRVSCWNLSDCLLTIFSKSAWDLSIFSTASSDSYTPEIKGTVHTHTIVLVMKIWSKLF